MYASARRLIRRVFGARISLAFRLRREALETTQRVTNTEGTNAEYPFHAENSAYPRQPIAAHSLLPYVAARFCPHFTDRRGKRARRRGWRERRPIGVNCIVNCIALRPLRAIEQLQVDRGGSFRAGRYVGDKPGVALHGRPLSTGLVFLTLAPYDCTQL